MNRRGFLQTCLIAAAAPAIVRVGSLMPVIASRLLVHPVIFPNGLVIAPEPYKAHMFRWMRMDTITKFEEAGWQVTDIIQPMQGLQLMSIPADYYAR